jgi:hypothetical protein
MHISCIPRILEIKEKEVADKLQTELVVHTETKEFFTRKQTSMQSNISEWETKYDLEIKEKDNQIKNVSKKRQNLLERLSILQNRKIVENLQNSKETELKNIEIEKIKSDKLLLKIQNRSTRVIVREIKAYIKYKKEVEALKGKSKKDKKGGKKGGKKK